MKTHRDLDVWKLSMNLTADVYRLTDSFPKHEKYGLTSQICRSAVSIASNIAEGAARQTKKELDRIVKKLREQYNYSEPTQIMVKRIIELYKNSMAVTRSQLVEKSDEEIVKEKQFKEYSKDYIHDNLISRDYAQKQLEAIGLEGFMKVLEEEFRLQEIFLQETSKK